MNVQPAQESFLSFFTKVSFACCSFRFVSSLQISWGLRVGLGLGLGAVIRIGLVRVKED
jgi:hypothetical protein